MSSERISDSVLSGGAAAAVTLCGRPNANPTPTAAAATRAAQPFRPILPPRRRLQAACPLASGELRRRAEIGLCQLAPDPEQAIDEGPYVSTRRPRIHHRYAK